MCRLLALSSGQEAATATFWLLDAPDSLSVQSHREPDGTGLGWFDRDGAARISKQPIAAFDDKAFAREAHELTSRTFVAHIRFASTGDLTVENTHPFEQDGRLFAHNGVIGELTTLDAHLGSALALVKGDTDSERFFALITRETATRGGDLSGGIAAACAWVADNLPLFAINFVLATDDGVWALRYPQTHELYVLERRPGARLEHTSRFRTRVSSDDGARRPLVTIASEQMDDDPGWRPLASGELLHVGPRLQVSARRILEGPPTRALTLHDLDERARASQATVPA